MRECRPYWVRFFSDPANGASIVRFCFCKKLETLLEARDRLLRL